MKKLFFLFLAFNGLLIFGQNQPPKMPKYKAKNAAGIFYYDAVEAAKKIKLKKEEKISVFSKIIKNYNNDIKNISFLNGPKLNDVELTINSVGEQAFKNPDLRSKIRKMIEDTVIPVRDSVLKKETNLNKKLEEVLSSKQLKKWLRYQTSQKNKLIPKPPQNNQSRNNGGMMQRNRMGGMGRRRF